jgi:GTP-binding protein Era
LEKQGKHGKEASQVEDASSLAVIEQFLADTGGAVVTEGEAVADWHDEVLPEGHKSGFVAIIGRPNVGKSTLVNALIGHKVAIVSPKPQTTRNRITGILTETGYQMIFIDTPGIHMKPGHKLNALMIEQAVAAIPNADVILFVVDVAVGPRDEDEHIAQLLKAQVDKRPVIFVLNKMDQLEIEQAEAHIESYWTLLPGYADSIPTSALQGTNLDLLREHILKFLPEGPRYYPGDQITDQTEHQIAAELIREAMLHFTHQEVPHAAAVFVEDYHERENGVLYVSATIWVERDSQKPIVIGKQGQRLKQIGTAARAELERFIEGKVYLELWVKVQPQWRDRDGRLRELGF